jgi:hypothetical protein
MLHEIEAERCLNTCLIKGCLVQYQYWPLSAVWCNLSLVVWRTWTVRNWHAVWTHWQLGSGVAAQVKLQCFKSPVTVKSDSFHTDGNQSFVILIPDITKYVTTMCSRSSLIVSSRIHLFFHVNRPFLVLPDIQSLLDHLFSHTICLIPSVPYLSPIILPSSLSHFTDIPFNAAY